jgi:glycosyltransferase involved in cell wall biosynthesis
MQNLAPIALFVYNRPDHTSRTLASLKKNVLAAESNLFIFSDGPKTDTDQGKVDEVRDLINKVEGFKSVKVIARKENLGLANSIIIGVSQLVSEFGKIIVFEDDLVSSPHTLEYFNEGLTRYQHDDGVMHIGSYMYPLDDITLPETFFYRIATSWGWATWARAWKNFEPDINKLIARFNAEKKFDFSIEYTMNFWKQMEEFKAGKNNSWAIRWYASIFLQNGLTLNPSRSLVHNIGHDGTGVHSNVENMYGVNVSKEPIKQFPAELKENEQAHQAIKRFLKNRKGTLLERGMRLLKQWKIKSAK